MPLPWIGVIVLAALFLFFIVAFIFAILVIAAGPPDAHDIDIDSHYRHKPKNK